MINQTTNDFKEGDEVVYLPVSGRTKYDRGIVSSTNSDWVFVKYYLNGKLQDTSQATNPTQLLKINK